MRTLVALSIALGLTAVIGCHERINDVDITPPSSPQGLISYTGDNAIELYWNASPEPDVAGYRVYVALAPAGQYQLIGSTVQRHFVDLDAVNGTTYYYTVTAYDFTGNESRLAADVIYDTPRPEGHDVIIDDYRTYPNLAGYDFSTYSVGPYDDQYTDFYFENYNGTYYLDVWTDTDIQDMGYTNSLYDIAYAPAGGWSPTKDVRVIAGHTYAIRTWDNHYAKVWVTSVSSTRVMFDWAYQLQVDNPRLKIAVPSSRGSLTAGPGAASRSGSL